MFPVIQRNAAGGPNSDATLQNPFWVASSLAAFWCLPEIGQDTIDVEDAKFRALLRESGFDTSKIGLLQQPSDVEQEPVEVEQEKSEF